MKPGKTPLTTEAMKEFLTKKGIAKQYWPEYLEIFEDFPRTMSGKIQKFLLRKMVDEKLKVKV